MCCEAPVSEEVKRLRRLLDERTQLIERIAKLQNTIKPMIEAYRMWAVGQMTASDFGALADPCVIAFDEITANES